MGVLKFQLNRDDEVSYETKSFRFEKAFKKNYTIPRQYTEEELLSLSMGALRKLIEEYDYRVKDNNKEELVAKFLAAQAAA